MAKKNRDVSRRTWKLLRLALVWAQKKGSPFRRSLVMEMRFIPKFLKSLSHATPRDKLHYFERQLSFDKTPVFQVKMHRPASMRFLIPCLTPQVDFDYDFDGEEDDDSIYVYGYDNDKKSFLKVFEDEGEVNGYKGCEEKGVIEEEGIDSRAEKFIANFYKQMNLQRQISYLEYNEMLNRGTHCL
ncbi:DUF761 domain-containing protein [Cephalotus follicularis]|uniref:DUF761 domain-containing protein n=1 Tax=Cephalotus follicularis TaxID=3775 RepID=A0A1Q3AMN6_CEPFO|nr:DUF761 domain-containing protein [Cephalotus follicularis]